MTRVDFIVLCVLLCFSVICFYLLYLAYNNITSRDDDDLSFFLMIFSILFLLIKFNLWSKRFTLILNIPLIIAYYKRDRVSSFITSILLIIYYYFIFNINIYVLIFEYFLLFFIRDYRFCILFISLFYSNLSFFINIGDRVSFIICSFVLIFLFRFSSRVIEKNVLIRDIEKNRQVHNAIFRITHEIKNPIAVCKGYLDMFDFSNRDHLRYIPIIKEEINKTLVLLEDFLMINNLKLREDILDINFLVSSSIDSLGLFFKSRGIIVRSRVSDDEVFVLGDYDRLGEVFDNVFKNSVEAGGTLIDVWSEISGGMVNVFIRDNGSGIDVNCLGKIKEMFFTTKVKGTGLGVPLSDRIIRAHGGEMEYSSEYGEYTLVRISLPISN